MFSTPRSGWTCISIGNFKKLRASYVTQVPDHVLQSCLNWLKTGLPFAVNFDAEGWEYSIISGGLNDIFLVFDFYDRHKTYRIERDLEHLVREIHADFQRDIDAWARWEPEAEEDIYIEKMKIQNTLDEISRLLQTEYWKAWRGWYNAL